MPQQLFNSFQNVISKVTKKKGKEARQWEMGGKSTEGNSRTY